MSILCATDFSPDAHAAADVGALLAKAFHLPLHLVHCERDYIVMGDLPVIVPNDRDLSEQLEAEAGRLRKVGVAVTQELRHGPASAELVSAARQTSATLIVLGSSGRGTGDWLLGSVASDVAENASVPTLVVRQPEILLAWLRDHSSLDLLCGVDLKPGTEDVLAWGKKLTSIGRISVGVVHIRPVGEVLATPEDLLAHERDVWDVAHARLGDMPLTVHVREVHGRSIQPFLDLVKEKRAGLVLVGSSHRRGWQRLTASSFTRRILTYSGTNVLCVPVSTTPPADIIPVIQRVLVAADLGGLTSELLRHAHGLLLDGRGAIKLVHVCHEPARGVNPITASEVYFDHGLMTARAREEAVKRLQELPATLVNSAGIQFSSEVLTHHDIAAAICAAAERFGADVICMGTHGRSRMASALLGSTVQGVLSHAHKPVLVVPPPS